MLLRYISRVPFRYFKMVRYCGFLSNPKRGALLPKVYAALEMEVKTKLAKPGYASLMKQFTNVDPYQCVLCGSRMVFSSVETGVRAEDLLAQRHHQLEKSAGCWQHREDLPDIWVYAEKRLSSSQLTTMLYFYGLYMKKKNNKQPHNL